MVSKYFFPWGSPSMPPGNRILVDDLSILLHRPRYPELLLLCTLYCHCCQRLIPILPWLALFLWSPAPVKICEKHRKSFISVVVWAYKLAFLFNIALKTVWKIWLLAFNFVWFWSICYSTKLYHRGHSSYTWYLYYKLDSKALKHDKSSSNKWSSIFLVCWIAFQPFLIKSKNLCFF